MKKLILLFFLTTSFLGQSKGQLTRQNKTMAYNWPHFRLNGERLNYNEVKQEFAKVPDAYAHFRQYRPKLYIGLAALISSVIILRIANSDEGGNTALYITAGGLSITSLVTILGSMGNRNKAVRIYNDFYSKN